MKKIRLNYIISLVSILLFITIAIFIVKKESLVIDEFGYNLVSKFISEFRTPTVKFITNFGSAKILIPMASIIMIILVIRKKRKDALLLGCNLLLVTIINMVVKNIFKRARPTILPLIEQGGYSFPSGHTMATTAFYGYLIYLVYKNIENKYLKWFLIVLLSMIIFLIGSSRIYLGVHYTSDVLAGFLLSLSYLIIFISFTNKKVE
ncbi:MAG: phosphatase PAP2 family protein [Bacilli bacterium]|nr:phosphatase PAP2 family protein [Bacilli bacterium]